MRFLDTVARAGRSLRQAKVRTILTSLAIGVGAFTITLALAAGEGGRQFAADTIASNADVHEIYVQPGKDASSLDPTRPQEYSDSPSVTLVGGFTQKLLSQQDIDYLESLKDVDQVTPIYDASLKYVTRADQKKYLASLQPYNPSLIQDILAGSVDKLDDQSVILPDSFVSALGFKSPSDAIGKSVTFAIQNDVSLDSKDLQFKVAAVTKSSIMTVTQGSSLTISRKAVGEIYKFQKAGTPLEDAYYGAVVHVEDESNVAHVKQKLETKGYDAQTAKDIMGYLFTFINVLMGILIGFGALALLTSVFGIINTQYISVLERTQQIGLMKALGMRGRDVSRLFKFEAAWIGFLGGAIGSGLAYLVSLGANPIISDILSIGDSHLLIFKWWFFVVVIGGVILVAIVSGIMPARKAMKLDPIEALRTE